MWFLFAFISAVFSAVAAVTQKKVLFNIKTLPFSFVLSIFNLLLLIPVLFYHVPVVPETTTFLVIIFKSFLGSAAFYFVMKTLENFEISRALPLMAITPAIVAVFSYLFLGDVIGWLGVAGLISIIAGTYFIENYDKENLFAPFRELIMGENRRYILFALGIFSLTAILDKLILGKYKVPPIDLLYFQQFFAFIFFGILFLFSSERKPGVFKESISGFWKFFLLIAVVTIGYRYFQLEAVKLAPVALVLSVKRLSVLFASAAGGRLFNEKDLSRKLAAVLLILCGIFLIQAM